MPFKNLIRKILNKQNLRNLFIILFIALLINGFLRFKVEWAQGDEPHYLLVTQSIIKDGDLDLKNNYDNKDYMVNHWSEITDRHITLGKDGGQYSIHGILLPLIITPGYFLFGRLGAILTISFLSFLLVIQVYKLLEKNFDKRLSLVATFIFVFNVIFILNSTALFPDLLTGLMIIFLFNKFQNFKNSNSSFLISLIIGLLVWNHFKLLPFLLVFVLLFSLKIKKPKAILKFLVIPIISLILFSIFNYQLFGSFSPIASFTPGLARFNQNPAINLTKSIFDQSQGVLFNAPLLIILIFAGLTLLIFNFKKIYPGKKELVLFTVISFGYIFLHMIFDDWYGGYSPAGRYWMQVLPVLTALVPLGLKLVKSSAIKIFLGLVLLWNFLLVIALPLTLTIDNNLGYNTFGGPNKLYLILEKIFKIKLTNYLPRFLPHPTNNAFFISGLITLALSIIFVIPSLSIKNENSNR